MNSLNGLVRYFDLYSRRRTNVPQGQAGGGGQSSLNLWLFAQFVALYLGIISKLFLDSLEPGGVGFSTVRLVVSLIVATAIFPAVYKQALEAAGPGFVQLCVVFAAGLGYKTLIDVQV